MFDVSALLELYIPFLHSPSGALMFVFLYILWIVLLLPGLWLTMAAGLLYGPWLGTIVVFLGAFFGAELVFFLSRTLFRDFAQGQVSKFPKLFLLGKAVSREGLKLIFLSRLSPVLPFSFLNLAYGLSEVTLRDYTIGLIGILPGTILYCCLGAIAGDLSNFKNVLLENSDSNSIVISWVGLLATVGVAWLVIRAANKAFQESDPLI